MKVLNSEEAQSNICQWKEEIKLCCISLAYGSGAKNYFQSLL